MSLITILFAIAVGFLAYLIAKWLLGKFAKTKDDAEALGAIVGVAFALWRLGVIL